VAVPKPDGYWTPWHIANTQIDALAARLEELQSALRELVALKDMHDQFDAMKQDVPDVATAVVLEGIGAEYRKRKPAAWERARALVNAPPIMRADAPASVAPAPDFRALVEKCRPWINAQAGGQHGLWTARELLIEIDAALASPPPAEPKPVEFDEPLCARCESPIVELGKPCPKCSPTDQTSGGVS
jgi:hypothetical protein